jgi:hypothetical protein
MLAARRLIVVGTIAACSPFSGLPVPSDAGVATPPDAAADATPFDAGADAPGACVAPRCPDAGTCRSDGFDGPSCPSSWVRSGDSKATFECSGGKLHVAAEGFDDVEAKVEHWAPGTTYRLRVGAELSITTWSGRPILQLYVARKLVLELFAQRTLTDKIVLAWCLSANCAQADVFEVARAVPHLLSLEVTAEKTALTVDCAQSITRAPLDLPLSSPVEIAFGATDGNPIDATLDDVVVEFY